ncbi:MAG: hypothetical protein EOO77_04585 [Oxalobacteraceae bacterium]|nr:MAG: hypothetical protein EOO77_04585 [Oxalobacteraceae bacterium]
MLASRPFGEALQYNVLITAPYGLKCKAAPDTAYAYAYEVSDAIGNDAAHGYAKQILFLKTYNQACSEAASSRPNEDAYWIPPRVS